MSIVSNVATSRRALDSASEWASSKVRFRFMDIAAIRKARERLVLASESLKKAGEAKDHTTFSGAWYFFLIAAKNIYTSLEQGSKASPQSMQWFGSKKKDRKNDELLQYLFQARDDDEHGLGDVTKLEQGSFAIGKSVAGSSDNFQIRMKTGANGDIVMLETKSLDGKPVVSEIKPSRSILLPVNGRGNITYPVPKSHLGQTITDQSPIAVGRLGLNYLERLIGEAADRAA